MVTSFIHPSIAFLTLAGPGAPGPERGLESQGVPRSAGPGGTPDCPLRYLHRGAGHLRAAALPGPGPDLRPGGQAVHRLRPGLRHHLLHRLPSTACTWRTRDTMSAALALRGGRLRLRVRGRPADGLPVLGADVHRFHLPDLAGPDQGIRGRGASATSCTTPWAACSCWQGCCSNTRPPVRLRLRGRRHPGRGPISTTG